MSTYTAKMKPKTRFGLWLRNTMISNNLTCTDVAKELGTTRQNVRNHIVGVTPPSFAWVIAYCWLFNQLPDVNEMWNWTQEEL